MKVEKVEDGDTKCPYCKSKDSCSCVNIMIIDRLEKLITSLNRSFGDSEHDDTDPRNICIYAVKKLLVNLTVKFVPFISINDDKEFGRRLFLIIKPELDRLLQNSRDEFLKDVIRSAQNRFKHFISKDNIDNQGCINTARALFDFLRTYYLINYKHII